MRNVFLASALVLASSSDGCESEQQVVAEANQRRIQVVENWSDSDLKYKLIRDNKTEREWMIITDTLTDVLVVVPLDGDAPVMSVKVPE